MEESTKQNGNRKTKESADNSSASETDEEEIVPTTPVNRKRGKRRSPFAETDEEEIVPTTPVQRKRGKRSSPIAESSDEEPVGKKGRYVNTSKSLGGKSDPFIDSDDDGDRCQNIGSVFTSSDRDLLVRIEKRLECFLKKSSNSKKARKILIILTYIELRGVMSYISQPLQLFIVIKLIYRDMEHCS